MTTPDVPLRMELTVELPGTPEQVWDAIATANGITSWFIPTEFEEREGGAVCFHMGEDMSSSGFVTGWDPPRRLEYSEPDWAELTGHKDAALTPMVTEFLVEARSGGTCVLRVVSSAFGTGADWEQEFFDDMAKHWRPFFDNLRLYLTHFPGQRVTSMSVNVAMPGEHDAVWSAIRQGLGAGEVGQVVEVRGVTAQVERISTAPAPSELLLRVTDPVDGLLDVGVFDYGDGKATAAVTGYFFSDDAATFVERERAAWTDWLQSLAIPAT